MYTLQFTKEELDISITQLGARIDHLKALQVDAGKAGNVGRVVELEEYMKPLISAKDKMLQEMLK